MSACPSEFYDEQAKVYWILSFMQTGTAQNWQNFIALNIAQQINNTMAEQFLMDFNKKFRDIDKWTMASLKLRTILQEDKHADERVQDFEKVAMNADYNSYPLIVEFKCSLNLVLWK